MNYECLEIYDLKIRKGAVIFHDVLVRNDFNCSFFIVSSFCALFSLSIVMLSSSFILFNSLNASTLSDKILDTKGEVDIK